MNRLPVDNGLSLEISREIPKPGPEIYILRLKGNNLYTMTILQSFPYGITVHWNGKKTEPHFKEEHLCPGCLKKQSRRYKYFVHCICHEMGQEVFLELTPHSAKSLELQLGKGTNYRGNRIQVKRTNASNGRLHVSVLTRCETPEVLPQEKDPLPSILALWGIDPGSVLGGKELPTRAPSKNGSFH